MAVPPYSTDALRWLAVQSKDASASEAFVYCVRTTNIYCRPTCAARLARRANVEFRDTAEDAERDGYRACKRCRPNVKEDWDPWSKIIREACQRIEDAVRAAEEDEEEGGDSAGAEDDENGGGSGGEGGGMPRRKRKKKNGREGTKLSELAKGAGLTQSHFHRVFKKITRMTTKEYRYSVSRRRTREASGSGSQAEINQISMITSSRLTVPTPFLPYEMLGDLPPVVYPTAVMTPTNSSSSAGIMTPPPVTVAITDADGDYEEEDPEILDIDAFLDDSIFEDWTVQGALAVTTDENSTMMPYPPALSRGRTRLGLSRQSTRDRKDK